MNMEERCQLKLIVILSDGVRGHLNQSRGVAGWLARATGAEILEAEVPALSSFAKFRARAGVRRLRKGNRRDAREWMVSASGETLLRLVGQWFAERGLHEGTGNVLIISAGSSPAPYNLALSYIWRCACATIMTPSALGTDLFDFAIVPEHDYPELKSNIVVTLGSPNSIDTEELQESAAKLLVGYPSATGKKWSLLIGGDDANYVIDASWIENNVRRILLAAAEEGADLYITTSRRTSQAAEQALEQLIMDSPNVRYALYASRDDFNPIPAMLGFSDVVFCTEDSVNMVSETITGGHTVILMRTGYRKGIKRILQQATVLLAERDALPRRCIWGVPRFDTLYDRFMRHGVLLEFEDWFAGRRETLFLTERWESQFLEFNEAKKAAQWICRGWRKAQD